MAHLGYCLLQVKSLWTFSEHVDRQLCCFFRKPYHSKLEAFVNHMSKGPGAAFESPLHSLPLYSSHQLCEMGELTQTGQYIDHSSTYSSTHSCVW